MRTWWVIALAVTMACTGGWAADVPVLVPGPAEFVAGPRIQRMAWAPTGQYVLAVRERPASPLMPEPDETSIVLWNAARKESRRLLRTPRQTGYVDIQWFPRANTAMVVIPAADRSTSEVWRVDARRAEAVKVADLSDAMHMAVSPTQPLAVLFGVRDGQAFARRLTAEAVGPDVPLDEPLADPVGWSEDGTTFYFAHTDPSEADNPAPRLRTFSLTSGTAGLAAPPERYGGAAPEPEAPFRLEPTTVKTPAPYGGGAVAPWASPLRPLWLMQPGGGAAERVRLAADAEDSSASPRQDAVAYWNREGGFVVPLVRVGAAAVKDIEAAATREELTERAKVIGAAVGMYAADHDDQLPGATTDPLAALAPYVGDGDLLAGFQYTFGGSRLSEVERPETVPLGHFNGPGGRAVLFVDGHVEWQDAGAP